MQDFGKRLAAMRSRINISQAELARSLGVSKMTVSHWERNKRSPSAARIEKIARALHCRPNDLLAALEVPLPRARFRGGPPEQEMSPAIHKITSAFVRLWLSRDYAARVLGKVAGE